MKNFIKKNWKSAVKGIAFVLIFIMLFSYVQDIFELKGSCYGKYECYQREEKNSIDAIYLGNSRVNRSLNPLIIDEIAGIRSFNMGVQGLRAPHVYYRLLDALKTQKPKLVVIESSVCNPSKESLEESYIQRTFLSLPFSPLKVKGAIDLGKDLNMTAEVMFPLLRFHGRFREIDTIDYIYNMDVNPAYPYDAQVSEEIMNVSRGYQPYPTDKVLKDNGKHIFDKDFSGITDVTAPDEEAEKYFRKFVETAEEAGAQVLIISIPSADKGSTADKTIPILNYFRQVYADDPSVNFLDFNVLYDELDFGYSDMHNVGHVNRTGSRKISTYLGQFIRDNYSLK